MAVVGFSGVFVCVCHCVRMPIDVGSVVKLSKKNFF